MSRTQTNKLYTDFSKGLITEVNDLQFPENATVDEENCDILNNGIRTRRRGIEDIKNLKTVTARGDIWSQPYVWKEPLENSELNFLVICLENYIHFFKMDSDGTYSEFIDDVQISTLKISSFSGDIKQYPITFTHGKGVLIGTHPYLEPFVIQYVQDTAGTVSLTDDTFSLDAVIIKIRDYIGLDDNLAVDEEPASLTAEHHYNLRNQGWVDPKATGTGSSTITSYSLFGEIQTYSYNTTVGPIADYFSELSRYPGNNKIWWSAKNSSGDFVPADLEKIFFGNTRAPRGHFILNAFDRNRTAVSGITGLTTQTELTRPDAVEFASGRVFYGHKQTVYFSPILSDISRIGDCFQEADPTSEDISDLIATDGGYIEIPDADRILSLVSIGNGIVVLASNGAWFIASGSQGFTATGYAISKISTVGLEGKMSVVKADNILFWWSKTGIQAIQQSIGQFGPIEGQFTKQNITDQSIKRFFNGINDQNRKFCQGAYDSAQNKIYWIYGKADPITSEPFQYHKILIFDLDLQAFVPWQHYHDINYLVGLVESPYFFTNTTYETEDPTFINFFCYCETDWVSLGGGNYGSTIRLRSCQFVNKEYEDWHKLNLEEIAVKSGDVGSVSRGYESYLITGHEVTEDGLRYKNAPILGVFFKAEPETMSLDSSNNYTIDYPRSCMLQVRFDYTTNSGLKRWSRQAQVYRHKTRPLIIHSDNTDYNLGYDVAVSRNKIRGRGRAIQFKFSENRKNHGFKLIGWHVFYEGKTKP